MSMDEPTIKLRFTVMVHSEEVKHSLTNYMNAVGCKVLSVEVVKD